MKKQKQDALPETAIKRLNEAVAMGIIRGEELGTEPGRMKLRGQIGKDDFEIIRRFWKLRADYLRAIGAREFSTPSIEPKSASAPVDVDSEAGARLSAHERRVMAQWDAAVAVGLRCGAQAWNRFTLVVCMDERQDWQDAALVKRVCDALRRHWQGRRGNDD